ncbi:MAG TPA: FAD-binding protein [Micropepsaceae bacterium]|nr:FAD-binding protein [Micropepsaceae bacterium]
MSTQHFRPASDREAAELIRGAAGESFEIISAGTKRNLGRPLAANAILDMSAVAGVIDYKPEELVLSARAGTRVTEIERLLANHDQALGFEPCDWGPLFGAPAGNQTIAGVVAADVCGPGRVKSGSIRDHVIGCRFINGQGELIKAGGPVIKNVTGFDIPKLMCGAFGTLGVLTEVTLRVLPRAKRSATFVLHDQSPKEGLGALIVAAQTPADATALAYLPSSAIGLLESSARGSRGAALIRIEGTPAAIGEKLGLLRARFPDAETTLLDEDETNLLFRHTGDGSLFGRDGDIWRLCVPPSHAASAAAEAGAPLWYADWAGALLWLQLPASAEITQRLRGITAKFGGHATLFRAADEARSAIDVFEPEAPVRANLSKAIKQAFDPEHMFNRGRMFEYL